jgi:hypothetical protein
LQRSVHGITSIVDQVWLGFSKNQFPERKKKRNWHD